MNTPSTDAPIIPSEYFYFSANLIDNNNNNIHTLDNQTLSLLQFNHEWILPLFILSLFGILLTIIISFFYLYLSTYRLNNYLNLPNLFLCLSVCFIYIVVVIFLIRGNELFCGLREFLSQFAYALLYSALLCHYIMQWLSTRILSKRTKQLTSLLIYSLLVFIQIPIGILWWYFTIPRACQQRTIDEYPKLKLNFQKTKSSIKSCSFQCIVDYRFYATFTYTIIELFLCTIIAACLFLCRHCYQTRTEKDEFIRTNNKTALLAFFNMFAFVLINIAWLIWTFVYHFAHPYFVFPSVVIGMFTIGTICLLFILIPKVYFYSKCSKNELNIPETVIYTNKLAAMDDMNDDDDDDNALILNRKPRDQNKPQNKSNQSESSYELATSGTFLPLTRSPKGPFKVINTNRKKSIEKSDALIREEDLNIKQISKTQHKSSLHDKTIYEQELKSSLAPVHHQLTPSSKSYDLFNPTLRREHSHQPNSNVRPPSSSLYPSSYTAPHYDEAIIPILCNSQRSQSSTPVKMRVIVKSPSSSVPIPRRVYSGIDHRYIRHPYHYVLPPSTTPAAAAPPPPPPRVTPIFYSPQAQRENFVIDPYRRILAYPGENSEQAMLTSTYRYAYPHRRSHMDHRSLSQRLWDIDSGDEEDEFHENLRNIRRDLTPMTERLKDFRITQFEHDDPTILHIDDDDEDDEENLFDKKLLYI
ncbi:unnamed protein product [Rotaria magnacalcarata]|uniref:G-protein coupled receptors family 3 profile domain-containing protein n=1 Tax=Rotaria magnacalcarata TaxID=392030 RepID=A0A816CGZ9_9BILA|nr:unnamed protein product [Rotaria magnacalcarata]CAF1621826.1 unnamed protein product [Rotaria magnacalcarata]CAF1929993.1 unnamed protein product [Rotaria magnacalcarata]CAF4038027.1 unnamed protein product [Rotaria magnacalcarata]CAF4057350.1 unnamed protein product [Rotaria magnacalcarata]